MPRPSANAAKRTRRPDRRGSTCVEFAMTASVLIVLFFGLLEVARFHMVRHTLDQAAYEGARAGIVPGASSADVQAQVDSLLAAVGVRNATVSITPTDFTQAASQVSVLVQANYGDNSWASDRFFKGVTLSGQATLDRETAAVN
ncbi:MAG: TadE/TadG family type IV pilus assembly protein [Planctomycetota bacterium]